jgi:hypothetical protein
MERNWRKEGKERNWRKERMEGKRKEGKEEEIPAYWIFSLGQRGNLTGAGTEGGAGPDGGRGADIKQEGGGGNFRGSLPSSPCILL